MPIPRIAFDMLCNLYGEAAVRLVYTPISWVPRRQNSLGHR